MDEIAAAVKADPVEYRLRHLSDPRLMEVVRAAAKGAGWQTRPSPRPGIRRTGVASGRGISCVLYEGDNGYCAMVAEVDVNQDTGRVTVTRMVIANDCGPISNPDGLRNQLEGGALQGMSRALLEEVMWDDQKVTSVDWRTYRPLYLGADLPTIETVLINQPDARATGAGETAVTVAAGGDRQRHLRRHRRARPSGAVHARTREGRARQPNVVAVAGRNPQSAQCKMLPRSTKSRSLRFSCEGFVCSNPARYVRFERSCRAT